MTYYTIAVSKTECCGHGDYRTFTSIVPTEHFVNNVSIGWKFPPLFQTKFEAEQWMKSNNYFEGIIVPIETWH